MPKIIAIYRGVKIIENKSSFDGKSLYCANGYGDETKLTVAAIVGMIDKNLGQPTDKPCFERVNYIYRPKDGFQLLKWLSDGILCEVVDTSLFEAVKMLDDNNCGFSFSCKKSKWNKGWAGFERI